MTNPVATHGLGVPHSAFAHDVQEVVSEHRCPVTLCKIDCSTTCRAPASAVIEQVGEAAFKVFAATAQQRFAAFAFDCAQSTVEHDLLIR